MSSLVGSSCPFALPCLLAALSAESRWALDRAIKVEGNTKVMDEMVKVEARSEKREVMICWG
jgi:hypothetical protein